jgi:hypothetical protein
MLVIIQFKNVIPPNLQNYEAGKQSLIIPRRRWEDNIKFNHKEIDCGDGTWIEMAPVHAQ